MIGELRGSLVLLRPLTLNDAPLLAAAAIESRERYAFTTVPDGIDEAREYVAKALRQFDERYRVPFAIERDGRVVGTTSLYNMQQWEWPTASPHRRTPFPDAAEIGYTWLSALAQRTGVNTEAKYLLMQYAFEVWRIHRLSLRTDVRNERSWKAIERIGATFEGVWRSEMPGRDGTVRDSAYFSVVASEWPLVKQHLKGLLASN